MRRFILLASVLVLAWAAPQMFDSNLDEFWGTFKSIHNKQYDGAEEYIRRATWEKNLRYIQTHNLEADLGMHTFRLGMNEHGDMTDEEYQKFLKGFIASNTTREGATFLEVEDFEVPNRVDWRDKGYVTPVKNQAQCGSCWAFSATGSLEGQHYKKTKKLVSLSEQNLVDCATKFGTHGCGGGSMDAAFEYVKMNHGIDTETSYPYTAKNGVCHFKKSATGATDKGFVNIPHGDENALKKAVATVGPVSVAIDASRPSFRFYKSGVYTETSCSSTMLDHGVLAVGYGKSKGKAYWIVKNSWGTTWGDEGYIWMRRNHDNMCGIASQASYPLV